MAKSKHREPVDPRTELMGLFKARRAEALVLARKLIAEGGTSMLEASARVLSEVGGESDLALIQKAIERDANHTRSMRKVRGDRKYQSPYRELLVGYQDKLKERLGK